ncbi:MAG: Flp family type IVb pilin [Sphingorhabdus sp.]
MRNFVTSFLKDESGASAAEYALILAIVGTGIAGAAWLLGVEINTAITDAKDCIADVNAGTPGTGTVAC